MKRFIYTVSLFLSAAAVSCVREDLSDCPPEPERNIVVAVRDKNYDNAAEAGDVVVDENLPITSYISSLVLWNHHIDSDKYNAYEEYITDNEFVHPILSSRFGQGENTVATIGNENVQSRRFGKDANSLELHPSGTEGDDIDLGGEAVTYPTPVDRIIHMLRTKGKLIMDVDGMPDAVEEVVINVAGVYGIVREKLYTVSSRADDPDAAKFEYGGTVSVKKRFQTTATKGMPPYAMILAPSSDTEAGSPMTATLTDRTGAITSELRANIVIKRNHIARLRLKYDEQTKTWTITVLVDGNWVKTENLDIS